MKRIRWTGGLWYIVVWLDSTASKTGRSL